MKKITLGLFLAGTAVATQAQDYIMRTDSTEAIAKIISETEDEVIFKHFHAQDRPSAKIAKKDIISIEYENGRKDYYENGIKIQPATMSAFFPSGSDKLTTDMHGSFDRQGTSQQTSNLQEKFDHLARQIENTVQTGKKQSDEQTKIIAESLNALTKAVADLNATTAQGNRDNSAQNSEIISKLAANNAAVAELKDASTNKNEVYQLRKVGLGVRMLFTGITRLPTNDYDYEGGGATLMGTAVSFAFQGGLKKKAGFRFEGDFAYLYSVGDLYSKTSMLRVELKLLGVAHLKRVNFFAGPSLMFGGGLIGGKSGAVGGGLHLGGEYLISDNFALSASGGFNLFADIYKEKQSNAIITPLFMGLGDFGVKYYLGR